MVFLLPKGLASIVSKLLKWGQITLFTVLCSSFTYATTLLVHGDSLSAGYGMLPEQTWVALLDAQLVDVEVINSSISGETSKGGLERLPALLETHKPDILILELGANDGLRGYPIAQMKQNLSEMIALAKQENIKVALVGIRLPPNFGRRYTEPFYNAFAELATEQNLAYLPFLLEGVAQFDELMQADGLHPTQQAQETILQNVLPILTPLLKN